MHCDAQSQLQANSSEAIFSLRTCIVDMGCIYFCVSTGCGEVDFRAQILNIILLTQCVFMHRKNELAQEHQSLSTLHWCGKGARIL